MEELSKVEKVQAKMRIRRLDPKGEPMGEYFVVSGVKDISVVLGGDEEDD